MRSQSAPVSFSWLIFLILVAAVPCGWAQNMSGIFLTPVANAPFTGVIVVERTTVPRNGSPVINLSNMRQLPVRPTDVVIRYNDLAADPLKAAREMGVDTVLTGRCQKSGDHIRVTKCS